MELENFNLLPLLVLMAPFRVLRTRGFRAMAMASAAVSLGSQLVVVSQAKNASPRKNRVARNFKTNKPRQDSVVKYDVLVKPMTTEAAVRRLEANVLSFFVDLKADKMRIKEAVQELYQVPVVKVNTLIRDNGTKAAFIKLPPGYNAADIAIKIGEFQ